MRWNRPFFPDNYNRRNVTFTESRRATRNGHTRVSNSSTVTGVGLGMRRRQYGNGFPMGVGFNFGVILLSQTTGTCQAFSQG